MRVLALLLLALSFPLAAVRAGTAPATPTITVTPEVGGPASTHQVVVSHVAAGQVVIFVLFAPDGQQTVYGTAADGNGDASLTLTPVPTWEDGVYRIAASLPLGAGLSAVFVADDGLPHLYTGPASPGSWSTFALVGTGLPPNTATTVHLVPTGGILAPRDFPVTTDAAGIFELYVWPQQLGMSFFEAGAYTLSIPAYGVSTTLVAREHPGSAAITVPAAVPAGASVPVAFSQYAPGRYVWGVYAGPNGQPVGEFLVGPTDEGGRVKAALSFPYLGNGTYYIATPYDLGETTFTVIPPTPTATPTATVTPTPRPVRTTCGKKHHGKPARRKHQRRCR
ncbi:MAG TPA: hypothetical protein VFB58_11695 [Chloroflexota bacterium]|nr:hypothetical protein [Chloroflexota bacterium]